MPDDNQEIWHWAETPKSLVYLASSIAGNSVQTSGLFAGQPTIYARELNMPSEAGYTRTGDYMASPK
jgi:hypothetical protein